MSEKEKMPAGNTSGKFFNEGPSGAPNVKATRNTGEKPSGTAMLRKYQQGKSNPDSRNT